MQDFNFWFMHQTFSNTEFEALISCKRNTFSGKLQYLILKVTQVITQPATKILIKNTCFVVCSSYSQKSLIYFLYSYFGLWPLHFLGHTPVKKVWSLFSAVINTWIFHTFDSSVPIVRKTTSLEFETWGTTKWDQSLCTE